MERTKKDFIKSLIEDAKQNTWKNELAITFKEAGNESDLSVTATKEHIKRDASYIKFLEEQLALCE